MTAQPNRMERPNIITSECGLAIAASARDDPLPVAWVEGHGVRLYGSAMVDGVLCWYHPETDLLVPASRWEEFIEKLREELDNEPEQPS